MDPMQLFQLMQMMHQKGGMFGGQQPAMQSVAQMPPMGQSDQLQSDQQHRHGGLNPLMLLSPLMGAHPKLGMSLLSPAFGANLLGAFK
jgi:hypothetical protein